MKLSEEQTAFYDVAKNFALEKMAPNAEKWDEEKFLPVDILKELAQLGFAGIYVSPDMGGSGLSRLDSTLIFEGLSQGCTSTSAFLSIHNMATWMIDNFGV
ncbi:MAG: acyl-CoA dehydrogenase family protein, partial [Pseudomonadota bacterium]|nr:acyl-CoA dehydrogenase family protein [Pseudomonadota bacterium]